MAQRLKSWESPRRQGRNKKGKGGSARQRQLKKQQQMLRKKLKEGIEPKEGREVNSLPFFIFRVHLSNTTRCDTPSSSSQPATAISLLRNIAVSQERDADHSLKPTILFELR